MRNSWRAETLSSQLGCLPGGEHRWPQPCSFPSACPLSPGLVTTITVREEKM